MSWERWALAAGRAVQRQRGAHLGDHAQRALGGQLAYHQGFHAVQHGEIHRVLHGFIQAFQSGAAQTDDIAMHGAGDAG